jgi:hypothetical protein
MNEMANEPRWCGCPTPKDYPSIDIHGSKCLRKNMLANKSSQPKELAVGNTGHIPKAEMQPGASDARTLATPTHQSYFRIDGSLITNYRGTKHAWRAFDNRRRRNAGEIK